MDVNISAESIELLATKIAEKIADKLSQAKHEKFVGIKELSEFISVPVNTIHHWSSQRNINKMPIHKKGRQLLFKISEVQQWMSTKQSR